MDELQQEAWHGLAQTLERMETELKATRSAANACAVLLLLGFGILLLGLFVGLFEIAVTVPDRF